MERFNFGLPISSNVPIGANWYIWTPDGVCIGERLDCIAHDSIVGVTIEDIAAASPKAGVHWKYLQEGQDSTTWMERNESKNLLVIGGFMRSEAIPDAEPGLIYGFSFGLEESLFSDLFGVLLDDRESRL